LAYWTLLATLCLSALAPLVQGRQAAAQTDQSGSFGIQLLDAPTDRRSDPRALKYIVDHLAPGAVIHRRVLVVNKSSAPLHMDIYPSAATVGKGSFRFATGHTANELTSWISAVPGTVDLPVGGQATSEVTIQVPPRASPGERYGVVWSAVSSSPNPSANVNQVFRAGVRVYLDVGPGGDPPSDFTIGGIVPARTAHGVPSLSIAVHNTGQRALDMSGEVMLTNGPADARVGPFEVSRDTTLAPGQSGTVTATLPRDLPNGPWTARIDLASGLVKHSITGRVTFPAPGGHSGLWHSLSADHVVQWTLLIGAPVLALTGLAYAAWRQRIRPRIS
jgi:hypothetical protein